MATFAQIANEISRSLNSRVAVERDAEWQRVNSLIADVLKDAHVLYAKLARLQGDFAGAELDELESISEGVLAIGGKLSTFSKSFYEGGVAMTTADVYGSDDKPVFGGSESLPPEAPAAPESAPPALDEVVETAPVEVEFDYSPEARSGEASEEASKSEESGESQ